MGSQYPTHASTPRVRASVVADGLAVEADGVLTSPEQAPGPPGSTE